MEMMAGGISGSSKELSTILGAEELNSLSDEIKEKIERVLASKTSAIDSLKASQERPKINSGNSTCVSGTRATDAPFALA